jgi:serine phosphatase RsbU (regulator of sigma subunit)/PAS domain-containing protein/anti-sigma regulatory factor (Ser/Thr protein kinase)
MESFLPRGSWMNWQGSHERPKIPTDPADAARIRLIRTATDLDVTAVLRLALQQAVAATGALGGIAHVVERGVLRPAAVNGIPQGIVRAWEGTCRNTHCPPSVAVGENRLVWSPDEPDLAALTSEGRELSELKVVGALSLPVTDHEAPVAALTLLMPHVPSQERREFASRIAREAAGAMPAAPAPRSGLLPWWNESTSRLREAMTGIRVGTWEWNIATGQLLLDEAALDTARTTSGMTADEFDNHIDTWMQRIHPDDLPGVLSAIEAAIGSGEVYSVEYRLLSPEGRVGWIELRGHTTYSEQGEPLRMTGTSWDTTNTRMTEQALARILLHMPDAFLLVDPSDWRILYANAQAAVLRAEPVDFVGHSLWEPEIGLIGLRKHFERAVSDDRPVTVDVEIGDTWQRLRLIAVDPHLVVHAADITAEVDAQRASDLRTQQIATFTEALAQALTTQDVVAAVAAEILPPFGASSAVVYSMSEGRLMLVGAVGDASEHIDHTRHSEAGEPTAQVPRFVSSVHPGTARTSLPGAVADLAEASEWEAWAQLPLTASGRLVGYLVISFEHPRKFTGDESGVLIALSGLVAQGLERARLYDAERSRAGQLQQALLPTKLPSLPAVKAAARYRPASDSTAVGGDWYDTIPLSGERVALVMGDVMGHGLHEAITMSRIRTAVSTLATLDHPPEEMLAHLNDVVFDLGGNQYVTCLYAVYDSTSGVCSVASAGHPTPAIVPPHGRPYYPDVPTGPPLGVSQPPYQSYDFELREGSLLLLYTDGLTGVPDAVPKADPEAGRARLLALLDRLCDGHASAVREKGANWLERLCATVVTQVPAHPDQARDDAAVLAVHTLRVPRENIASVDLPWSPESAGLARRVVQQQLAEWHLDELIMPTELIVSELIGNVVRHARGPIRLRLIRSSTLTCEVWDGSQAAPRRRHAAVTDEDGRGLQLVSAMAQRWGTRYVTGGKITWAEQAVAEQQRSPSASAAGPDGVGDGGLRSSPALPSARRGK